MTRAHEGQVTIVSGLPRSGTSMMMRMLAQGGIKVLSDNIREADVDNPLGYYEFEPVKQTKKDASWVESARGKAVKMVYLLLYDLPDDYRYQVVFMNRRLEEVVESQNVMLERLGKQQGAMSREQLIENFESQLRKVNTWLDEKGNFHVLQVDYNAVISDPGPTVLAVNEFLGGKLNTDAMLKVVDPALYRRRKE